VQSCHVVLGIDECKGGLSGHGVRIDGRYHETDDGAVLSVGEWLKSMDSVVVEILPSPYLPGCRWVSQDNRVCKFWIQLFQRALVAMICAVLRYHHNIGSGQLGQVLDAGRYRTFGEGKFRVEDGRIAF
jgi:hypothetical protein